MAGTSPAMTVRLRLCSHFVLDPPPNLGYIVSSDLPLSRGALARRRSVEAGTVPQARLASGSGGRPRLRAGGRNRFKAPVEQTDPAWNGHRAGTACPPKQAVREEASRLFLLHHPSSSRAATRATLDQPSGSQHPLRAHRCWLFDSLSTCVIPDGAADPESRAEEDAGLPSPLCGEGGERK